MWLSSVELVRSWSDPQCRVVASKALLPVAISSGSCLPVMEIVAFKV